MNNPRIFIEVDENCACSLVGIHPLQVPRGITPDTNVTCLAELGGGVLEILWAIASRNTDELVKLTGHDHNTNTFFDQAGYGAEKILQEIVNVSLPDRDEHNG